MRAHSRGFGGFSLIEVVISVGIFAGAIVVLLGLLPSLARQAAAAADSLNALHLSDGIRVELQRVATGGGLDLLANQAKPASAPLPDTLTLVASRDSTRVQSLLYQPPPAADRIPQDQQYFLVEVWRLNQPPLAFNVGDPVLALRVRVSWPYHVLGSATPTPLADRAQVSFNLGLSR